MSQPTVIMTNQQQPSMRHNARRLDKDGVNLYPFPYMGTKIRMLEDIESKLPKEVLNGKLTQYIEPFMGGGSVLLRMLYRTYVDKAFHFTDLFGFDNSEDLVIAHNTLRSKTEQLLSYLSELQGVFNQLSPDNREVYYYQVRNRFNDSNASSRKQSIADTYDIPCEVKQTARFIFLINTAFGRKVAYNKSGLFNTTFNLVDYKKTYKPLNIAFGRLYKCAELFKRAKIGFGDFSTASCLMTNNTFCYLDPPYVRTNANLPITPYGKKTFTLDDQKRLKEFMLTHSSNGSFLMMSNTGDGDGKDLVEKIYEGFHFHRISVNRRIGVTAKVHASKDMQTTVSEYIITTYPITRTKKLF